MGFATEKLAAFAGLSGSTPLHSRTFICAVLAVILGTFLWIGGLIGETPKSSQAVSQTNLIHPSGTFAEPPTAHHGWNWSRPFPWYVHWSGSYAAGFLIGWFFRKLIQMITILTLLVLGLLAYGHHLGMDTTHAHDEVIRERDEAYRETITAKNYLVHLLPSAGAAAAGALVGFRRRSWGVPVGVDVPTGA